MDNQMENGSKIIKINDINKLEEFNLICEYFMALRPREFFEKRAQNNIKTIEIKEIQEGFTGEYNFENKRITINKNIKKNLYKNVITHELLHALTYRSETSKGFKRLDIKSKQTYKGISIDEAITESLTQKITKVKDDKTYSVNIKVYELLKSYIGEAPFISDYLYGGSRVDSVVKEKYGNEGFKMYNQIKKELDIFTLASHQISNLNKEDKEEYENLKDLLEEIKESLPVSIGMFKEICHIKTIEKYTIR